MFEDAQYKPHLGRELTGSGEDANVVLYKILTGVSWEILVRGNYNNDVMWARG